MNGEDQDGSQSPTHEISDRTLTDMAYNGAPNDDEDEVVRHSDHLVARLRKICFYAGGGVCEPRRDITTSGGGFKAEGFGWRNELG